MIKNNKGFTLIELVMVIVILGILAAVAIPRFIDLRADARRATARGVEGAIASAAAMLHSQYLINGTLYTTATGGGTMVGCTTANYVLCNANVSGDLSLTAGTPAADIEGAEETTSVSITIPASGGTTYTLNLTFNSAAGPRIAETGTW